MKSNSLLLSFSKKGIYSKISSVWNNKTREFSLFSHITKSTKDKQLSQLDLATFFQKSKRKSLQAKASQISFRSEEIIRNLRALQVWSKQSTSVKVIALLKAVANLLSISLLIEDLKARERKYLSLKRTKIENPKNSSSKLSLHQKSKSLRRSLIKSLESKEMFRHNLTSLMIALIEP